MARNQNSASFEQYEVYFVVVIFSIGRNRKSEILDRLDLFCAFFRSKNIQISILSTNRLHGGSPRRGTSVVRVFYVLSSLRDLLHAYFKIGLNFPGFHRVLPLVINNINHERVTLTERIFIFLFFFCYKL